jgi:hypothetical protein
VEIGLLKHVFNFTKRHVLVKENNFSLYVLKMAYVEFFIFPVFSTWKFNLYKKSYLSKTVYSSLLEQVGRMPLGGLLALGCTVIVSYKRAFTTVNNGNVSLWC